MAADGLPLLRELDELAVNAVSPDRSLRVSLTARSGLRIETGPGREPPRSETELARQVSVTVGGVLRKFAAKTDSVLDREAALRRDGTAESVRARRNRLAEDLDAVEVSAVSARGLVEATMCGRGDVRLRIKPRSIDTKGTEMVLDDIRDGLAAVMERHELRAADVHGD